MSETKEIVWEFNSGGPPSIKRLTRRSEDVVNVFTKTIKDLTEINSQVSGAEADRLKKKARLEAELADLDKIKQDNQKVIDKINKIFE